MNLVPAQHYLLVCKCTDPFLPEGKLESGIDVSPTFKYVPLTPRYVLAVDPASNTPFAKVGAIVYAKFGEEEGFVSGGGNVSGFLHENLVRGWIAAGEHDAQPVETRALELMDAVRDMQREQEKPGILMANRRHG